MLAIIQQLCSMKQKHTQINTNKSTHSEMGPVRRNPFQIIVITAHLSVLTGLCTASVRNTTQNSSDNLPSYIQTNIIAQMLSTGGEEVSKSERRVTNPT